MNIIYIDILLKNFSFDSIESVNSIIDFQCINLDFIFRKWHLSANENRNYEVYKSCFCFKNVIKWKTDSIFNHISSLHLQVLLGINRNDSRKIFIQSICRIFKLFFFFFYSIFEMLFREICKKNIAIIWLIPIINNCTDKSLVWLLNGVIWNRRF